MNLFGKIKATIQKYQEDEPRRRREYLKKLEDKEEIIRKETKLEMAQARLRKAREANTPKFDSNLTFGGMFDTPRKRR